MVEVKRSREGGNVPVKKGEEDDVDNAEVEREEEHDGLETEEKRPLEVPLEDREGAFSADFGGGLEAVVAREFAEVMRPVDEQSRAQRFLFQRKEYEDDEPVRDQYDPFRPPPAQHPRVPDIRAYNWAQYLYPHHISQC